jgi:hypothetical protein
VQYSVVKNQQFAALLEICKLPSSVASKRFKYSWWMAVNLVTKYLMRVVGSFTTV